MLLQIGDLEQELVWSLLAKPPVPPPEARSHQAPNSGLFESSGTRGYTAGGPCLRSGLRSSLRSRAAEGSWMTKAGLLTSGNLLLFCAFGDPSLAVKSAAVVAC